MTASKLCGRQIAGQGTVLPCFLAREGFTKGTEKKKKKNGKAKKEGSREGHGQSRNIDILLVLGLPSVPCHSVLDKKMENEHDETRLQFSSASDIRTTGIHTTI